MMDDGALMSHFCSLGSNCEFGIAQRFYKSEPLDLFRWGNTTASVLVRILKEKFAGIGDPDQIEIFADNEYMVRHRRYGFIWHAWIKPGQMSPEEVHERERRRLPFLARKAIEELTDASRFFVVKDNRGIPDHVVHELVSVMREYGNARLIHVTEGELGVEAAGDGLFSGRIPAFAPGDAVPTHTDSPSWLSLCRRAFEMAGMQDHANGITQVTTPRDVGNGEVPTGSVTAHVHNVGDTEGLLGDWLGARGGDSGWVEGFFIVPLSGLRAADIEYQTLQGDDQLSAWVRGGTFCGTRGKMSPIHGFSIRLRGDAGLKCDCSYSATFADGTTAESIPAGSICAAASRAPLKSFRIVLRPRASPPVGRG